MRPGAEAIPVFTCPHCNEKAASSVKDSRPRTTTPVVVRRRECSNCHKRYTTYETTRSPKNKPKVIVHPEWVSSVQWWAIIGPAGCKEIHIHPDCEETTRAAITGDTP